MGPSTHKDAYPWTQHQAKDARGEAGGGGGGGSSGEGIIQPPSCRVPGPAESVGGCIRQVTAEHDPEVAGLLHAITYSPHWEFLRYLVVDGDAHVSRSVDIPVAGHPLVHDLAFTENYIVVFDLPVTLKMDGPPSSSFPYEWNEDHQPRVGLMPRAKGAGEIRWFEVPSCFLFHAMNAFEDGDRVIVDFIRHQRMFVTDLNGPDECVPMLARWIFDLKMAGSPKHCSTTAGPSSHGSTRRGLVDPTTSATRLTWARESSTARATSTI